MKLMSYCLTDDMPTLAKAGERQPKSKRGRYKYRNYGRRLKLRYDAEDYKFLPAMKADSYSRLTDREFNR